MTRALRYEAHKVFDPIWRRKSHKQGLATGFARKKAYRWLARELGLDVDECHIGFFDAATCRRVIALCRAHCARSDAA
jgi:hypothetical protein